MYHTTGFNLEIKQLKNANTHVDLGVCIPAKSSTEDCPKT